MNERGFSRADRMLNEAPPEVRAMHAAFVEATGYPVLLNYTRAQALMAIVSRDVHPPLGPDDLKAVVRVIKADIAGRRPRFTESSLQFGNLLGDPDIFEDRALACRAHAKRKASLKPKPPVAETGADGATRLVPAKSAEPKPSGALLAGVLRELAAKTEQAGSEQPEAGR